MRAVAVALVIGAVALGACKKAPPPECTFDLAALENANGLAKKKVQAALELAKAAAPTNDAMRCQVAQASVASAKEAVERAKRAKAEFDKETKAAEAALVEAREHGKTAVAWIDAVPSSPDADPVGPNSKAPSDHVDMPGQVRAFEKALDDDENHIKREKDAAALSGYDVAPEVMMSIARRLEQRAKSGLVLEVESKKAALAVCKPKTEVNGVESADKFLVMKAPTSTLFYVVDGGCKLVHTEKKSIDLGKVSVWKPKKPQATTVLVGWSRDAVVFVGERGGFSTFKHGDCGEPTIAETVEATCDGGGHARYVWDGARAIEEP